jgi:hypothetical protein
MARDTVTENERDELEGFGPAINDETMKAMEEGATSKARGLSRRYALIAIARDSNTLGQLSRDEPKSYDAMRKAICDFKAHARALLDVAEAASLRMELCDCRDDAEPTRVQA